MNLIHKCENCIWFDKCFEDGDCKEDACDGYDPVSSEELEETDIAEYEEGLRERYSAYRGLIAEQNE